jgi:energy-converting hydrogenase Eha subunit F
MKTFNQWLVVVAVVGSLMALAFNAGQVYHHGAPESREWEAAPCSCYDVSNPDCFV